MKIVATATVMSGTPDYHQDIRAGRHVSVADMPADAGGKDAGPAPYEYVLAGLGACTTITLCMYARRKGWDIGEVRVDLMLVKNFAGYDRIERVLHCSGPLSDAQWARLITIAGMTPVTKTLKAGASVVTTRSEQVCV